MSTFLKSANFKGKNGLHFHIDLYYTLTQSVENNTSTITYDLWFVSTDGYSGSGASYYGYIGKDWYDRTQVGSGSAIGVNQSIYVGSTTRTYTHNADGTGTASYYALLDTPWDLGAADLSGTLTLPRIDRYATLSSAQDFTDEGNPKITFTKNVASGAVVYAGIFNSAGTTAYASYRNISSSVASGEYTFNLTTAERNALRNAIPNAKTMQVQFKMYTTISGTNFDGGSITKTMSITNANPTLTSPTYSEQNAKVSALLGSSGSTVVQNASTLRLGITATALKSASISKVVATHSGSTYTDTSSPYSFDIPIKANSITLTATDSRTNTGTLNITKTMLAYTPVAINTFSFKRQTETSSTIILNLSATYYQQTFGSTANAPIVKWKKDNGSWTTLTSSQYTIDNTNHKLTVSNLSLGAILDYQDEATFTIYIEDKLSTAQNSVKVTIGIPTLELGKDDVKVNGDFTSTKFFNRTWDFGTNDTSSQNVLVSTGSVWHHRAIPTTYNSNTPQIKMETLGGRITNANISHTYEHDRAHLQLLISSTSMTSNKPAGDGFIIHCSWDNSGQYNGQLYITNSNSNTPLQFRGCSNGTWGAWEDIYRAKQLYYNTSGSNGTITLTETASNFKYIEIYFGKQDKYGYNSVKVYTGIDMSKVALFTGYRSQGIHQIQYPTVKINGTSITKNDTGGCNLPGTVFTGNEIYIYRVVGYR